MMTWLDQIGARPLRTRALALCALMLMAGAARPAPVRADTSWDGIRAEVYGTRTIRTGAGVVTLEAPYRPDNVMAVPLSATAKAPRGQAIRAVSFIVDENPSPVAATFTFAEPREQVSLTTYIRLNQQSDVRVVAETVAGDLFMSEQLVKFAGGQASCSAPPQGDPAEIAANMGRMDVALTGPRALASNTLQTADFHLNHPNHTGMVLNQITLHYIPLLMVDRIEIRQGDAPVLTMTGSITLAQNPRFSFDFMTNGATGLTVTARDTSGATWERTFPIGPGS